MEFDINMNSRFPDKTEDPNNQISIRAIFEKYAYYWKWFLLSVLFSFASAYLYLQITQNQYLVSTTIFIDDKESGGIVSELSAFEDLGTLTGSRKKSVINEMGVLESRTLLEKVIKNLGLTTTFYQKKGLTNMEIYKNSVPFNLKIHTIDSLFYRLDTSFSITPISQSKFLLKIDASKEEIENEFGFGEVVSTGFGELVVTPKRSHKLGFGEKTKVTISPLRKVVENYRSRINISVAEKKSSLVVLSLKDKIKLKAQDLLDNLVIQYNRDAIDYKTIITGNTDSFINDRITDISAELTNVDVGVEEFKTKNKLSDIGYEANLLLISDSEVDKQIVELSSQIKLVDFVLDHVKTHKDDLIPANLGLKDVSTNQSTVLYNQLLLERNRIIKNSSELNPTVINLDAQIATLRQSVEQSLVNLRSSLQISLADAQKEGNSLNSKKANVPRQEREFQDIKRKQQIVEALFLYLLEKREENAISLGIPVPNAKLVDKADGSNIPVSPKKAQLILAAIFVGLIIPIIFLYIKSIFDNKVQNREDVESFIKVPFLGDIPHSKRKNEVVVLAENNNNVAEAFRLLRTNVGFMLSGDKGVAKTIFITSTTGSEGKSFIAINLAASLALLKKRVLVVESDIRKPKLNQYLKLNTKLGLCHYLNDNSMKVEAIISNYKSSNFDVIHAGVIPPNPSELLLNGRFEGVLSYGKTNYDFVIVDTSPVNQVTDTLLLGHHADLFIYVIRANYLDKRMLKIPKMMVDDSRLPNLAILINDLNVKKEGYGYGYGYGETKSKKSWWKFY